MDAFKRAHKGAPGCDCSDCRGTSRTKRARLKHADRQMLATIERYTDGESCRDCGAPCGYTRICTTCGRWGEPVIDEVWRQEPALSRYVQAVNLRAVLRVLWPERPELAEAPEMLAAEAWRQMGERQREDLDRAGCGLGRVEGWGGER